MNDKRAVIPTLLIVILITMVVSTYSWLSSTRAVTAGVEIWTGVPTSLTLSSAISSENGYYFGESALGVEPYCGQIGWYYDENSGLYSKYSNDDAPYVIDYNMQYSMYGQSDVVLNISLEKIDITLGNYYNKTLDYTIANVFGVDINNAEYDSLNYYSSSTSTLPSGSSPSEIFCVYSSGAVTHIIITGSLVDNYFEYDYWESSVSGINRGQSGYTSAKDSGINLSYANSEIAISGATNYIKMYIGFVGKNTDETQGNTQYGTYCMPFSFSSAIFQESTFDFYFLAEAN